MVAAAALGIAAKLLRQPLLLAYLGAGALIGYFSLLHVTEKETFQLFSDLGIMFLLFLVGMEINYPSLRAVGKASLVVGLGQIIFTFVIGFVLALLFQFSLLTSAYIAIALTFSSTIIIIKLLSDKKDTNSLYGKISIGMLLVQDFIAILLLVILAGIQTGGSISLTHISLTLIKGVALFLLMLWLGKTLFPRLFDVIARSQELLFLTSLTWVFLVVAIVKQIGFSIEIGGFLAGLALANSSEHFQIANFIRPLRDFFIVIFFVILGSLLVLSDFQGLSMPIIVFSLFVLLGNPLIVLILMGLMGYRKRTGFLTGLTVAQISEFSLVLAALGLKIGHISESTVALITGVGIITITLSTYMIVYADYFFRFLSGPLTLFERSHIIENDFFNKEIQKPVVLVGYHRTGQSIALNIPKSDLLVVEFDPDMISLLKKRGYEYIFDDIADPEVMERANLTQAKLIISTSPDAEDNMTLLTEIKKRHKAETKPKIIARAETEEEAKLLYEGGADYVLLPHFTAGEYLGKLLSANYSLSFLDEFRKKDLARIS